MYQIFVAEDEPASLKHILTLVKLKCSKFEVIGTADNGRSALEEIEKKRPDVLITDVKMPVIDGIELVRRVKEKYPAILSVIISGYQEFEYARAAIQAGVCDYILKPVKPSTFQDSMRVIQGKLDRLYYIQRKKILRKISKYDTGIISDDFIKAFPAEEYYVTLFRKNGLPRRFTTSPETEILSIPEEQIIVYGRDEMETLYICPKEMMLYQNFYDLVRDIVRKESGNAFYHTVVLIRNTVTPLELPDAIQKLYQKLDVSLVIGESQIITLPEEVIDKKEEKNSTDAVKYIQHYLEEGERKKAIEEVGRYFARWEKQKLSQLEVEDKVREIIHLFCRYRMLNDTIESYGYYMDEAFYYAENMSDLADNLLQILDKGEEQKVLRGKIDTEEYFRQILEYMQGHLCESLSPQVICRIFGISQTYLCRMFRNYMSKSFSKVLNEMRIEKACEIMKNRRELFVKEVAALAGYSDQFYFSRIFRAIKGISPSEYMEDITKELT